MVRTSIQLSKETKDVLDKLKIHHRETYEDVVKRLIEFWREQHEES